MGCDIHGIIQVQLSPAASERPPHWGDFLRLDFVPRDYQMFGLLARVRGDEAPEIEPRRVPEHWRCLHDEEDYEDASCGECPLSPDSHTPTWLTGEEYRQALVRYDVDIRPLEAEYIAISEAMIALGNRTRLVLWFDN